VGQGRKENMTDKELIRIILDDGWYFVRQTGGHRQFKHPVKKGIVTVPYKIKKNIELSVMRQAGIKRRKK
jgi:predicted RNA binding protein YcfA (HicA-like mRNA interferase family)